MVPADKLIDETIKLAEKIASHSPLVIQLCKDAVNRAYETTLEEGLRYEKRTFHATFATVSFTPERKNWTQHSAYIL